MDSDWPTGEETDFNMVLMNPPYSAKWSAAAGFLQDERFSDYGVLAPKSKADYAFLLHGLYHLKNNGTMAIVLPHGVLFRGAAEGKIREKLLKSGNIYAVIGLPSNLFYNTPIPTCIVVLKKHRDGRDVLFIDASKKFEKGKKQNTMKDEHIDAIVELYHSRKTVDKESYLASFEDIEKNDFNLNIPRYVDNFEKEEEIDLNGLLAEMKQTDNEINKAQEEFIGCLKELTATDPEIMLTLNNLIGMFEGGESMSKPNIRFRGYTEDWEQRKLGDISESYSGGTPTAGKKEYYDGDIPFIRSGEISGDKTELFITDEGLNNSSAKMVKIGDILYALYGATSGEVSISKLKGAINQAILAIHPHEDYDSQFLMQWLRKSKENIIGTYLQGGQGNLSGNIVKQLLIDVPTYEEQKKIGAYFEYLDNLITLHQRKCEETRKLKKYMLQKMFSQNEKKFPEIRFQGFTEDWEQRKLGEMASSFEYGLNAAAKEYDGENKYIRITDIDDNTHEFLSDSLTSPDIDLTDAEKYKLSTGDILFARTGASVGKSYIYRDYDGLVYYAGFLIRARIKDEYDAEFVFQNTLTDKYNKYIAVTSQRSGQPGVNAQEYSEFKIQVPKKEEQIKIGKYFQNLDNLITLHQQKYEELQKIKKFMLQNMFV